MRAGVYCRACWYDLRGIESRQCPECGLDFDPNQPGTFVYFPGTRLPDAVWSVLYIQAAAVLLLIFGIVLVNIDQTIAGYEVELYGAFAFCFVPVVQLAAMIAAVVAVPIYLPMVQGRKRMALVLIGCVPWAIAVVAGLGFWLTL